MSKELRILIDFVAIFVVIFLVYKFIVNRKKKDYSKLSNTDSIKLFAIKYNLNMKKQNFKKILNVTAVVDSFILSLTTVVILRIDSIIWSIIVGFVMVMMLIYSFYEILGRYFKRKEDK